MCPQPHPEARSPLPAAPQAVGDGDALSARVVEVTTQLLHAMGVDGEVSCTDHRSDDSPHLWVEISSAESGLLIGDRGSTLSAFEHILRRCLRSVTGDAVRVIADVNAYRIRRTEIVRRLARAAAMQARRTGRAVVMEPMRAADRRVVHLTLTAEEGITTESTGEEPTRRVLVRPTDPLA